MCGCVCIVDQMNVFEIAIKLELADFFDSNRVGRVCSHMWSEIDFLNPKHMFRTKVSTHSIIYFTHTHKIQYFYV